jgi:CHAT domain-containing protein
LEDIGNLFDKKGYRSLLVNGSYSKKEVFLQVAQKGDILHLATHYFNNSESKSNNGFLFANTQKIIDNSVLYENLLTIDEICNLQFHADLVVLNACASGIERLSGHNRNIIPEIFLMAGARNTLTTLWNVTDRLAGRFMVLFYRLLLEGKSYSAALREAKLQMIRSRETSLPTVWAPYILTSRQ